MKFSHSFNVEKSDIDDQGHVNNVAYLRFVQNVAVAHWLDITNAGQRQKYTWVVTRHEIDYKKPAFENRGNNIRNMGRCGKNSNLRAFYGNQARRNFAGSGTKCLVSD